MPTQSKWDNTERKVMAFTRNKAKMAVHSRGEVNVQAANVIVLTIAVQRVAQFVVNCAVEVVVSSSAQVSEKSSRRYLC